MLALQLWKHVYNEIQGSIKLWNSVFLKRYEILVSWIILKQQHSEILD